MDIRRVYAAFQEIEDLHWRWHGNMLITCREDGSIPLNSKVVLEVTEQSSVNNDQFPRLQALIAALPSAARALKALHNEITTARADNRVVSRSSEQTNMISATMLLADRALESIADAMDPDRVTDAAYQRYNLITLDDGSISGTVETNDNADKGEPSEFASWDVKYPNYEAMKKQTGLSHQGVGCKVIVQLDGRKI